jgi:Uma2 family endonuclease
MVQTPITSTQYPDSDGKPMADNTLQYQWIVYLVENLRRHFAGQTVFVAGDLLWYPVLVEPGQTPPRQAPDVMVVFGRPQRDRSSYKQWDEDNIAPQVVFEIISPSNTVAEMANKQTFYARHGVLEMYFYDPDSDNFWGFARETLSDEIRLVMPLDLPWTSPLLQIRFEQQADGLSVFYPDGEPFKTLQEFAEERDRAQQERDRALAREAQTQQHLDRAIAKLKELGIDPDTLNPS